MDIYLASLPVSATVELVDRNGNDIAATAASYRVLDGAGSEIVLSTPVPGFTEGDRAVTIDVPSSANVVLEAHKREVRTIEISLTLSGGVAVVTHSYGLEASQLLADGKNSFQTIPQASLVAMDLTALDAWHAATENEKIAAMVEAREHILDLYFDTGSGPFSIRDLNDTEYQAMDSALKTALCRAQVAEADYILGGRPAEDRRIAGVVVETIGESKQMYRHAKPIDFPVGRRALKCLTRFVVMSKRIVRV